MQFTQGGITLPPSVMRILMRWKPFKTKRKRILRSTRSRNWSRRWNACKTGDLPPGGVREKFHMLTCLQRGKIIGYVTFYEGYPVERSANICFFYLVQKAKHQGAGTFALSLLTSYFQSRGFERVCIGVSLKNWPALRFLGSPRVWPYCQSGLRQTVYPCPLRLP